jgi:Domain of unknown function (DUF4179)
VKSTEEVESRLRSFASSALVRPADERAIAEIHAWPDKSSRPPAKHQVLRVSAIAAVIVLAILLVNVLAAYYAPKYQRALADSSVGPISQRLLSAVGLKSGDVTVVGDSATSAGHTLKLVGAYADGLRTVIFVSVDGKGVTGNPKEYGKNPGEWGVSFDLATLTDQFGHSYGGQGVVGPTDLQFQPLAWPASDVGGRLTLHITGIWAMWKIAEQGPNTVIDTEALTTHGDWSLHVTLISAPSHTIGLPAPVHTATADYTFTGITASETEMVLHWNVSGPVNDGLRSAPTPQNPPSAAYTQTMQDFFTPRVYDANGTELQMQDWGYTWPKTGPAQGEMTVFINGPGRYRIRLGNALAAPDLQRWVVVP